MDVGPGNTALCWKVEEEAGLGGEKSLRHKSDEFQGLSLLLLPPRAPENWPAGQLHLGSAEHSFPWTPQLEAACLSPWRARGFQPRLG